MEESRALSKLNDATDLLVLLEDILNPASIERLSSASWSGVRLTLRNARVTLQESQSSLSKEFVARARTPQSLEASAVQQNANGASLLEGEFTADPSPILNQNTSRAPQARSQDDLSARSDKNNSEQSRVQITRRDLKATLEKFIETR